MMQRINTGGARHSRSEATTISGRVPGWQQLGGWIQKAWDSKAHATGLTQNRKVQSCRQISPGFSTQGATNKSNSTFFKPHLATSSSLCMKSCSQIWGLAIQSRHSEFRKLKAGPKAISSKWCMYLGTRIRQATGKRCCLRPWLESTQAGPISLHTNFRYLSYSQRIYPCSLLSSMQPEEVTISPQGPSLYTQAAPEMCCQRPPLACEVLPPVLS